VLLGVDLPLALVGFVWTTLPSVRVQPRLSCVPIQSRFPFLLLFQKHNTDADIQNLTFLFLHSNIVAVFS